MDISEYRCWCIGGEDACVREGGMAIDKACWLQENWNGGDKVRSDASFIADKGNVEGNNMKDITQFDPFAMEKHYAKAETTNDDPSKIAAGAIKYDNGKSPVFRGLIDYFPRACEQVAAVSAFGATKYSWKGWLSVDKGFERYSDALVRHLTSEGKGETEDRDSGLRHASHVAWNAMARLELLLRDNDNAAS